MRSSVIAAMIAAAMTSGRRAAPAGGIVMSGAVVTAALFANLGGGVNVGNGSTYSAVAIPAPTRRLWGGQSEACPHKCRLVGTAPRRLPTLRFRHPAADVIPQAGHPRN